MGNNRISALRSLGLAGFFGCGATPASEVQGAESLLEVRYGRAAVRRAMEMALTTGLTYLAAIRVVELEEANK